MKKYAYTLLALLALTGCEVTEETAIDKAADMVASELRDPASAKFFDLTFVEEEYVGDRRSGHLCGFVNSKNAFGGYTGKIRFSAVMEYTKDGDVTVKLVEMEEGRNEEKSLVASNGESFFEHFFWKLRCVPGYVENRGSEEAPETKIETMGFSIGQRSKPSTSVITPSDSPDAFSSALPPLPKGTILQIYDFKDGWIQVSSDPKSPQWIIPELLDW